MHACAYVIASMCGMWNYECNVYRVQKGESDVMEKELQAPVNPLVWILGVLFKSVRAIYTPPPKSNKTKQNNNNKTH